MFPTGAKGSRKRREHVSVLNKKYTDMPDEHQSRFHYDPQNDMNELQVQREKCM